MTSKLDGKGFVLLATMKTNGTILAARNVPQWHILVIDTEETTTPPYTFLEFNGFS